jgi:hypothetical protein
VRGAGLGHLAGAGIFVVVVAVLVDLLARRRAGVDRDRCRRHDRCSVARRRRGLLGRAGVARMRVRARGRTSVARAAAAGHRERRDERDRREDQGALQ